MNMGKKNTNKSGVTGVKKYDKDSIVKWEAAITFNYKNIYIIRHTSFDKAVKARLIAEAKYFKEYSPNFKPHSNTIKLEYISHDDNLTTFIEVDLDGNIINFIKKGIDY